MNKPLKGVQIDKSMMENHSYARKFILDQDLDYVFIRWEENRINGNYLPHIFDLMSDITSDVEFKADIILDNRHPPEYNNKINFKSSPSYVKYTGYIYQTELERI